MPHTSDDMLHIPVGFTHLAEQLAERLASHLPLSSDDIARLLEPPRREGVGHITFPTFSLARILRKPSAEIAHEIAEKLLPDEIILSVAADGPYVNVRFTPTVLSREALALPFKGLIITRKPERWVIEYPSPNTNKPLHLGHLRNMALGKSITRILHAVGHTVFPVNLNNDRGIAMSKVMVAYQHLGQHHTPADEGLKGDAFVGKYYVLYEREKDTHPEWEDEAYALLRAWEAGDPAVRSLWKKLRDWALEGFQETYGRFGVTHVKDYYESDLYERGKQLAMEGLKKGIFTRDEKGNILYEEDDVKKVILRADETAVYITTDLALAYAKEGDFHADAYAFVVGSEQNDYFRILFRILQRLGFPHADRLIHLSYGMVLLPEGRMKSREGKVVEADDLYQDVFRLALEGVTERHPNVSQHEAENRAHTITRAAIFFYLLKPQPKLDVTYHPEESLSFEGETGPYLLYTIVRAKSVLRKAGLPTTPEARVLLLQESPTLTEEEERLVLELIHTPLAVREALLHFKPSSIAQHALRVAQIFNEFYHAHPILHAEGHVRDWRLSLTSQTMAILSHLVWLLGLDTLEEM